MLLRVERIRDLAKRWLHPYVAILCSVVIVYLDYKSHIAKFPFLSFRTFGEESLVILSLVGFWIIATISHPESTLTRLLEWPPLRWFGRLSYSVYLWHLLFYAGAKKLFMLTGLSSSF